MKDEIDAVNNALAALKEHTEELKQKPEMRELLEYGAFQEIENIIEELASLSWPHAGYLMKGLRVAEYQLTKGS